MITAIVFVKADVARIPEVAEEIAALDGVSEVYSVTGQVDLIVRVPASDVPTLEKDAKLTVVKIDTVYVFNMELDMRDKAPQVSAKDGSPLDKNYGSSDIAPATRKKMEKDCRGFYGRYEEFWSDAGWSDEQAGHDFWLSRNGHGAGFFSRNYRGSELTGKELQKAAKAYGSFDLYIGDDGKVHGS